MAAAPRARPTGPLCRWLTRDRPRPRRNAWNSRLRGCRRQAWPSSFKASDVAALGIRICGPDARGCATAVAGGVWQAWAVQLFVWMASWQMECCGTPFWEGAKVSWRLRHVNPAELAWLDAVLHEGIAATVDAVEDHHGDSSAPLTAGTVSSIATLHCRFDPKPVAGSGILRSVETAEKWNDELEDRHFAGFLVRIRT